ncbi:hypothetical protein CHISP_0297 [Chitinispirillum alkaliphilum]|nr:hypothetical protein CHISP_0297 [Chitinispirillum alkaliphilum]
MSQAELSAACAKKKNYYYDSYKKRAESESGEAKRRFRLVQKSATLEAEGEKLKVDSLVSHREGIIYF